ncbi:MAG: hypothetical protein J7480_10455, partial [Microbacteriaceae bacterium]|nr:hypothetical protein [Microbacteriaceae bacterium]
MVFLRIDPRLPIVWRSPDVLQIGGESPRAVIDPVTDRDARMLAAVRAGIPSEALAAAGRCAESTARAFVARIRPALLPPSADAPAPLAAQVRVRSAEHDEITRTIRALGLAGRATSRTPRVGVLVADHA